MADLWSGVRRPKKNGIADNSNQEFVEYNNFVEDVKNRVKLELDGEVL